MSQKFSLIISILLFALSFATGTLLAQTPGSVWHRAEEIKPGVFGQDVGSGAYTFPGDLNVDTGQITAGTKIKVGSSELSSAGLTVNSNSLVVTSTGNVGIGTTSPKDKLDIQGNYVRGSKDISISSSWTPVLSINLGGNFRSAYVKLFYGGYDWSSHSATRYEAEFEVTDGNGTYGEPGNVVFQKNYTFTDQIQARLTHIDPDIVNIELRTYDIEENGFTNGKSTPNGKLVYEVSGYFASVGLTTGTITTLNEYPGIFIQKSNVGIGTTSPGQKLEVNGGIRLNTTTAKPPCDSTTRGTLWFTQGTSGAKDAFEVCTKTADDSYAWQTIY